MLLTIHNLPSSMRYADVKSLINEKCGLTEIILDNLVSEGKGKKVTVGLANDDDGALVVRKINGLYIQGQQLYIEDRRRKTDVHDQPYRSSTGVVQETRTPEPLHPSTMMAGVAAPNLAMAWNYNMAAAPYMVMPVDQNFAYPSYGGAPQAMQFMEPQPVVPAANERGYSGFQGQDYAPGNGPRDPDPVAWGRSGREQPSDSFRQKDRKRHHSPEKPAADKKKASRWAEKEAPKRREPSPPRHQRPQERNQGPRPALHQPEQFLRNEIQYQPRAPKPDNRRTDAQWEARPRRDDPNPRSERERDWGNDDNRNWEPDTDQVWNDQPNPQWRDEPRRWDNEPDPRWDSHPNPQWERDSRMPMEETRPEWYDRRLDEGNPPDHLPPRQRMPERGFSREFEPRLRDSDFNGRRQTDFNGRHQTDRNSPNNWNRDATPENLIVSRSDTTRHVRHEDDMHRGNRAMPNNSRQWRDRRDERSRSPRARSGGERENPDYWGQVANNYPTHGKPELERRDASNEPRNDAYSVPRRDTYRAPRNEAHNAPRNDRKPYKSDTPKKPVKKDANKYPPVDDRRLPPQRVGGRFDNTAIIPRKPQTLTSMINKDHSNRGQAAAFIAKSMIGLPAGASYIPVSTLDHFVFKQLKLCVRSRIDVMLGEELSSDMDDVVKRYRLKFPASGDRPLLKQIREKSTKEYEEKGEQMAKEREERSQVKGQIDVKNETATGTKKEPLNSTTNNPEDNAMAPDEVKAEDPNKATTGPQNKPVPVSAAQVKPNPVQQFPKLRPAKNTKPNRPLTDKQKIKQMKLQRKEEYEKELYNLDPVSDKALVDELAELDKLFTEEGAKADDPQEEVISKVITTDSLIDFNKTIRLYIMKRLLNIETGLAIRIFSSGKLPKKPAIEQYLRSRKIQNPLFKKSVKGTMYVINLCRFQDFDKLCNIGQDVIAGTPVNFKAMHLAGPPKKVTRDHAKKMRGLRIQQQVDPNIMSLARPNEGTAQSQGNINLEELDETEEYTGHSDGNPEEFDETEEYTGQDEGNTNPEEFDETEEYTGQNEADTNPEGFEETNDYTQDVNVASFNEDELEDF